MKLTYRGVSYEYVPACLEVKEGDIVGKYRGQMTRQHQTARNFVRPDMESMLLHYRGSSYAVQRAALPEIVAEKASVQAPAASCPVKLPQLAAFMGRDVRQVHIENMRRSLDARLRSAQEKGDQHLVSLLRQESKKLWMSS